MLKNIPKDIQMPLSPMFNGDVEQYVKDSEKWQNEFMRFMEDYARTLADNIMEQPRWDDLRVAAQSVKAGGSAPGFGAFGPSGGLKTYLFDSSTDEEVHFAVQIPHAVKYGTKLSPHVHWSPTTADTGSVCWSLEYSWANIKAGENSDYTFGAPSTITGTGSTNGVAWEHLMTELEEIDIDFTLSSMLMCRLYRDVSEDDYGADAALLEFDIHVQFDAIGSREEYRK